MAVCEFSGEECSSTIKVEIAGAVMNVSSKYAHLGSVIEESKSDTYIPSRTFRRHQKVKDEVRVRGDVQRIINQFISKNNLTTKHIAHNANVKEGSLQKMIQGKIHFDVKTAQAIEKVFDVVLTEISQGDVQEDVSSYLVENQEEENNHSSEMENLLKDALSKK